MRPNGRSLSRGALRWGGAVAVCAAAGALSAVVVGVALARRVVTPAKQPEQEVLVQRLRRDDERILIALRGPDAALPGKYSLLFDGGAGHARLGEVVAKSRDAVERELIRIDRGELREGARGRITGWWYTAPEELGLRVERISIPGEHGEAEAWIVHPRRRKKGRWAVHVHGRGAASEETLRGVAPLAKAGITSLVIHYRNDPGAPLGTRGRYGLGLSESRDVDAAIAEAVRRGATRVTLFGWSMGGTACLLAATRGPERRIVDGLVLDSPAIEWAALLRYQASVSRIPSPLADIGVGMLGRGIVAAGEPGGIDFGVLSADEFAKAIAVPTLIHASRGDTFVPPIGAERLAEANPRLVQLRLQEAGEHVKLWNVDPEPWERVTEVFVRALPRPAYTGE